MPRRAPLLRSNRSRDHRGNARDVCLVDRMMSHPSNFSSASTAFPVLGSSDVHVWFCDLLHYAADQEVLAALLSGDERVRAARFAFDRDRQRFVLSHALLRLLLSRYTHMHARQIHFATGPHGKPAISGAGAASQPIQFSLSHSGPIALVAVARGLAVGVDVEVRKADVDALKLAQRFFAPRESQLITAAEGDDRARMFYRLWAAKEAYLKGKGVGLSLGLDRVDVVFDGMSPVATVRWTDSGTIDQPWTIRSLSLPDHLVGAVAVEGDAWELHHYESTAYSFY